jgi:hypothetical protein
MWEKKGGEERKEEKEKKIRGGGCDLKNKGEKNWIKRGIDKLKLCQNREKCFLKFKFECSGCCPPITDPLVLVCSSHISLLGGAHLSESV